MDHCSYDTKHWPCTYCEAPDPKHVDAKCRNEEELYCPLCGEKVFVIYGGFNSYVISCHNPDCLNPRLEAVGKEKAIEKWRKYAR